MSGTKVHIEDLLTDASFIHWVKHPDEEQEVYWKHWLLAHPDRANDFSLAKEIVLRSDFDTVDESTEAFDEVLQRLLNASVSDETPRTSKRKSFLVRHSVRVAAVLVIVFVFTGLFVWVQQEIAQSKEAPPVERVVKQNQAGLKTQMQLPDGTMVWLNSESTLDYPVAFSPLFREVTLTGEAFFEIAEDKDRPFTIHSGALSTTALGTSLNISSYPNEGITTVSLVTGKVLVMAGTETTGQKMILNPGEQARHAPEDLHMDKVPFDYMATVGWKDGVLVFEESDLNDIIFSLERWYGVTIQCIGKPDKPWRINGAFRNQSLERVLERLSFTKDFSFQIDQKKVIIRLDQPAAQ